MICPKCAATIQDDSKFCPYCGENFEEKKQVDDMYAAESVSSGRKSVFEPLDSDQTQNVYAQSTVENQNVAKIKKSSQKNKVIIIVAAIVLVLILFAIIMGVLSDKKSKRESQNNAGITSSVKVPEYAITLRVKSVPNIVFSTYDIKIYIDNEAKGTLKNGDTQAYSLTLEEGNHTLMACSADDSSVKGKVSFDVKKDAKLQFEISSKSDEIEIESVTFEEDTTVETTQNTTEAEENIPFSTNDNKTAKKGSSGVYAYNNRGSQYQVYYIIDFDAGYVYYFTDGNGENGCEKVKIESGNLNDTVIITYHDDGTTWSYGLHFKYKEHPEHLIVQDNDCFDWDFYPTDLEKAMALKATKKIVEY
ncbi:MAG: zinc ribbon domain-containing protein [Clostridia bacterium]|nr:zinc ribbon domain-containing protein [Clostridia bacterium]